MPQPTTAHDLTRCQDMLLAEMRKQAREFRPVWAQANTHPFASHDIVGSETIADPLAWCYFDQGAKTVTIFNCGQPESAGEEVVTIGPSSVSTDAPMSETPWEKWGQAAEAARQQGELVDQMLASTPEEPPHEEEDSPIDLDEYRASKV